MFMKKRQHAQVMARVHESGECMEQFETDSCYSLDGDSDSGRDSVSDAYSNTDQNQSFLGGSEFETVQTCFKNVL